MGFKKNIIGICLCELFVKQNVSKLTIIHLGIMRNHLGLSVDTFCRLK